MGKIGDEAKVSWETNTNRIPSKSLIYKQLVADKKEEEKVWNEIETDVEVTKDDYNLSDDKKQNSQSKANLVTGAVILGAFALGVPAVF